MKESPESLLAELDQVRVRFEEQLNTVNTEQDLEALRLKFLVRKGEVAQYFSKLGTIDPEFRPRVGQKLNQLRNTLQTAFKEKKASLQRPRAGADTVDLTLPGIRRRLGSRHPLLRTLDEIKSIFISMGFSVESGPQAETDYYNFEALNIPPDHPSRDLQDTFYLSQPTHGNGEIYLLRTHTSPVQIRVLEKQRPPVRIIAPGRVFRKDTPDATHSPVFHQVEGLWVDEGVAMTDLKGVLLAFARKLFGPEAKVRFRPSFFPFTEPSAELDVWFTSRKSWLEMLGCGMVDPLVLDRLGIDSEKYTGFAFGMGVERLAMMKYGIDDIRTFFDNDVRFLHQF